MAASAGGSANPTVAEILTKLGTDPKTGRSVSCRTSGKCGPNALEEKKSALWPSSLISGDQPWISRQRP